MFTLLLIAAGVVALKLTGYLHFTPVGEPSLFQLTLFGYGVTIGRR